MINPGRFHIALAAAALICAALIPAFGAGVETRLEQPEVSVGESTILSIRVSGARDVEPGDAPNVAGLSISYRGNVSSFEWVNGKSWQGTVIQYEVTPEKEGNFVIPAIAFALDGKKAASSPVKLSVSGNVISRRRGGFPFPRMPGFPGFSDQNAQVQRPRGVRGEVELSKRSAYAGEAVIVRYNIAGSGSYALKGFQSLPETTGFVRKDLDADSDRAETTPGKKRVLSFIAVPQTSGNLSLGGGRAVLVDDDAWGPFSNVPVDFPEVRLEVKPLPSSGNPSGFSGSVGTFSLKTDADSLSCAAYEERRISATVSGTGNFFSIQPPVFENLPADVKCISSSAGESVSVGKDGVRGEKTFSLSVVPEREGLFDLGNLVFSYFDPSSGQYRQAMAGPVKLSVSGVSEKKESSGVSKESSSVWLWILLAAAAVAGVFGGIVWYERRKYALSEEDTEESLSDTEPAEENQPEFSRLKYELALARDRGDSSQFIAAADKVLAAYEKSFSDTAHVSKIRRDLYPFRFGAQRCTAERMAELEKKILSLIGG